MCALSDHQPANRQENERLNVGEITEGITVNTVNRKEHCAQAIISELEDRCAQLNSTESDTEMFDVENEHCVQSIMSELEDARTQRTSRESNTVKQRYTRKALTCNKWYISRKRKTYRMQDH